MKRIAYTLKLKPGNVDEYKRRHDEIWPELVAGIKQAGIGNFSIFLDEESLVLFAVQTVPDDYDGVALGAREVSLRWRDYMADIIEVHPGNAAKLTMLTEVFYLE